MCRLVFCFSAFVLFSSPALASDDGEGTRHDDVDDDDDDDDDDDLIRPIANLQLWATVWNQDESPVADAATYGDPNTRPGFQIYRARAGVEGKLTGPEGIGERNWVYYKVWLGVSPPYDSPTANLYGQSTHPSLDDAYGEWNVETGLGISRIGMGLATLPFDREQLIASEDLLFQERSVGAEWLGETRDTGAWASQTFNFSKRKLPPRIKVTAGAFDGSGGSIFGNATPGILEVGRLEFESGDAYRTWNPEGKAAFGLGVAGVNDEDPAATTQTWGVDLLARAWYVCLLAEYGAREIGPGNTQEVDPDVFVATDRRGAMAQLSFFIPTTGESGVEIGARYALFDDDTSTESTGDVGIIHAGATWRSALPGIDLGAGYVHRAEQSKFAFDNDSIRIWTQIRPKTRLKGGF